MLAAAGAHVTVFDLSEQQLAQDRMVAERNGLQLSTVQGDMRDLACFDSQIGGQLAAGFVLAGYHEEMHPHPRFEIEKYLPSFIATRAVRLARAA